MTETTPPHPRSNWIWYPLLLLTSGLPLVWWLFHMMKDVNALMREPAFKVGAITAILAVMQTTVVSAVFWVPLFDDFDVRARVGLSVWLLGLVFIVAVTVVLAKLYRRVAELEGRRLSFWSRVLIVVLTWPYLISFPFLQYKLNRLIASRWPVQSAG